FLLNAFLGTAFHVYGFDVIDDFIHNRDWTVNGRFPRVTLCDFKVRRLGHNVQRYTVQCVLPVNMFNEKIFMFLWFWFVIVSAATTLGFFAWLSDLLPSRRRHFIRKHLKVTGSLSPADADLCNEFVHDYLYLDGVFTLRLIGRNSNTIILAEFISQLWYYYRKKYKGMPLIPMDSDEESEETENDKKES
ncbi:innexin unc-9-like, partial [Lingula anatina]|uniref:Innexin n=1 Tax=Lingula anatina TaxID=7574 RepID=A0A1S3JP62_LINAN